MPLYPLPERIAAWLQHTFACGVSDLHLIAGYPPVLRLHGELLEMTEPALDGDEIGGLIEAICPPECIEPWHREKNVDFSMQLPVELGACRFRANLFFSGGKAGACLRVIPHCIPDWEWSGFPVPLAERIACLRDGLVLLCGATGSGKTTTLSMIVELLNHRGGYRILTVEEPIEYVFPKRPRSVVTQREVGVDVHTFADGLKYGLRQDPDVILVGEIRDRDTAQMALSAAETGHLVLSTLHTRDAKGAVTRYVDFFPQDVQREIRSQMALSLRVVIAQRLLADLVPGEKQHLALEVLWNTFPIASAIRTAKWESIDNYLLTGRDDGMVGFDESVRLLFQSDRISRATAEQNMRETSGLDRA